MAVLLLCPEIIGEASRRSERRQGQRIMIMIMAAVLIMIHVSQYVSQLRETVCETWHAVAGYMGKSALAEVP